MLNSLALVDQAWACETTQSQTVRRGHMLVFISVLVLAGACTSMGATEQPQDTSSFIEPVLGAECVSSDPMYCSDGVPLTCDGVSVWSDARCTEEERMDTGQLRECCTCPGGYTGPDDVECDDVGPLR